MESLFHVNSTTVDTDPVAEHDRILATNWDAAIKPDDQVWVLGDLSLGGTEAVARALNWIHDRPGTKHLITGNHDACWPANRDAHRWQTAYLQVFASVQPFARRKINGQQVLLSHFPYSGDHTTEERHHQYRLHNFGLPILHGHTHSRRNCSFGRNHWGNPTPQIHVGVDAWNLSPVDSSTIANVIATANI